MHSHQLHQSGSAPACVHRDSAMLIDNIFINIPDEILISGNIVSDISDHLSQFCIIDSISAKNNIKNLKFETTLIIWRLYSFKICHK